MGWREIPKIDAHIHILPQEVRDANPDAEDAFAAATPPAYLRLMEQYGIRKAVIMPFNDPWLMSMGFTADAVHYNLHRLCLEQDGRFFCFADVDVRNAAAESAAIIRRAFAHRAFRGIKLHPENSGLKIDDAYNDMIAECALALDCPVAVHSYPPGAREEDRQALCAPARIGRWMHRHPGLKVIVCHLGGFQWEDAAELDAWFDLSAVLPDLADRYGTGKTRQILEAFGAERLLFGTDWPCSRSMEPARILERYMEILDKTAFTEAEMHRICHGNIESLLGIPPLTV